MNKMLTLIRTSRTLIVVIIVVIVLITFFVVFLQPSNKNITYTVKRENLINTVLINGTYTTASQTPVNSPTNGIVTKSYVENDSIVKNDMNVYSNSLLLNFGAFVILILLSFLFTRFKKHKISIR